MTAFPGSTPEGGAERSPSSAPEPEPTSPCIGLCELDSELGLCKGCLRSVREITSWGSADLETRRAILRTVEKRERDPAVIEQMRIWESRATGGQP